MSYERMQDITVSYAQLAIKTLSLICGGALVSIGAAFTSLATSNELAHKTLKTILSDAFNHFSTSTVLIIVALAVLFFSRTQYLRATATRDSLKQGIQERTGEVLEAFGTFSLIAAAIFVGLGFYVLRVGFSTL